MELIYINEASKILGVSYPTVKMLVKEGQIPQGIMMGVKRGMKLVKSEVLKYKELRDSRKTPDEIRAYWLVQSANEGDKAA